MLSKELLSAVQLVEAEIIQSADPLPSATIKFFLKAGTSMGTGWVRDSTAGSMWCTVWCLALCTAVLCCAGLPEHGMYAVLCLAVVHRLRCAMLCCGALGLDSCQCPTAPEAAEPLKTANTITPLPVFLSRHLDVCLTAV